MEDYFLSVEMKVRDLMEYLNIQIDEFTRMKLVRVFSNENQITRKELDGIRLPTEMGGEDKDRLFYALAEVTGKKIVDVGWKGLIKKWSTKNIILHLENSFDLFRLTKYISKEHGKPATVAYPGSGQDSAGYVTKLDKHYVSEVGTFGIHPRVDGMGNRKVEAAGVNNSYFNGRFHNMAASHPELHSHFDVFIVEMTGAGGAMAIEDFEHDVEPLLKEDGILLVTSSNRDREGKNLNLDIVDTQMETNILDRYELVADTGRNLILKRKSVDPLRSSHFGQVVPLFQ
jgi:hypothetical protein